MAERAILLVDPEPTSRTATEAALGSGARVEVVASAQAGLARLRDATWDLVILSLDAPAVDLALVRRLVASDAHAGPLVLTAARPTPEAIIEASSLGVIGVFTAPLREEDLAGILRDALPPPGDYVPIEPAPGQDGDEIVTSAPEMLEVLRTVGRISASSATVLILGESGTGKEMVARAIHRHSDRGDGPFVAINCAAIPENLLESELFGHEKGAFTGAIARKLGRFERAHRGTLLLDEIGDMSIPLQSKILRALQEREIERVGGEQRIPIDVRVIAATNRDLRTAIAQGEFREDLYYRLAVVTVELPRLADRPADVDLLIRHFVSRYAAQYRREIRGVSRAALEKLRAHDWPGNVRELRNVVERAVVFARGPILQPEHVPIETPPAGRPSREGGYPATLPLAEVERLHIEQVLEAVDGHFGRAAEVLGIHRNTLTRKAREYGLRPGNGPVLGRPSP